MLDSAPRERSTTAPSADDDAREKLIEVKQLRKTFSVGLFKKRRVEAVKGVSFDVRRGEIFGFLGPNGLLLKDRGMNAIVIGPGNGVGQTTRDRVDVVLRAKAAAVIDADALTAFETDPAALFAKLHDNCVLTPHEGEFERLFPGLLAISTNRIEAARAAAAKANAVVLLKGPDTVIAGPDRSVAINTNAPADLATAGRGISWPGSSADGSLKALPPLTLRAPAHSCTVRAAESQVER